MKNLPQAEDRYLDFESEQLEQRQMLAGDVSVVARHGDVVVTGDNAGNQIAITDSSEGSVRVRGYEGTRINGVTNGTAYFSLEDDLRINLKNGDNGLELGTYSTGLHVPDDVTVRLGHGNDVVETVNLVAGDDLSVNAGRGSFYLTSYSTNTYFTVGDNVKIKAHGPSSIFVDWTIGGNAKFTTGHQNDSIQFSGAAVGDVSIVTRGGDDHLALAGVSILGDISIVTHGGNDTFIIYDSYAGGNMRLSMGHGYDTATIAGLSDETEISMSGVEVS